METLSQITEQIVTVSRLIKESAKNPNANPTQLMQEIKEVRTNELIQLAKGNNS